MSLSQILPIMTPAQLADGKAPCPDDGKVARIKAMAAAIMAARNDSASGAPDRPPALQKTLGEMAQAAAAAAAAAAVQNFQGKNKQQQRQQREKQ